MGDVCYEVILRLYEENTIYALFARDTIALSQSLGLSVTVRGMQMLVAMQVCDLFFLPSKKKNKSRQKSIHSTRSYTQIRKYCVRLDPRNPDDTS